mgnify:CR=1 FL=1
MNESHYEEGHTDNSPPKEENDQKNETIGEEKGAAVELSARPHNKIHKHQHKHKEIHKEQDLGPYMAPKPKT